MKLANAFEVYPRFKEMFDGLTSLEESMKEELLDKIQGELYAEIKYVHGRVVAACKPSDELDRLNQKYERHLKRFPKSRRVDLWRKWYADMAEYDLEKTNILSRVQTVSPLLEIYSDQLTALQTINKHLRKKV